jgi:carboxypeptidase Q
MLEFRFAVISLLLVILPPALCLVDDGHKNNSTTSGLSCSLSESMTEEIRAYKPVVKEIIEAVMSGEFKGTTYKDLEYFVDNFGSRLTGSDALEKSIDFMLEKMKGIGLENVHPENVTAPKWVR